MYLFNYLLLYIIIIYIYTYVDSLFLSLFFSSLSCSSVYVCDCSCTSKELDIASGRVHSQSRPVPNLLFYVSLGRTTSGETSPLFLNYEA